jgi:hypothetical protein
VGPAEPLAVLSSISLPKATLAPVVDMRTAFPYSIVDEDRDYFVRSEGG